MLDSITQPQLGSVKSAAESLTAELAEAGSSTFWNTKHMMRKSLNPSGQSSWEVSSRFLLFSVLNSLYGTLKICCVFARICLTRARWPHEEKYKVSQKLNFCIRKEISNLTQTNPLRTQTSVSIIWTPILSNRLLTDLSLLCILCDPFIFIMSL
jgi:hypothetical protein